MCLALDTKLHSVVSFEVQGCPGNDYPGSDDDGYTPIIWEGINTQHYEPKYFYYHTPGY